MTKEDITHLSIFVGSKIKLRFRIFNKNYLVLKINKIKITYFVFRTL